MAELEALADELKRKPWKSIFWQDWERNRLREWKSDIADALCNFKLKETERG
jgi:hypothetical protein